LRKSGVKRERRQILCAQTHPFGLRMLDRDRRSARWYESVIYKLLCRDVQSRGDRFDFALHALPAAATASMRVVVGTAVAPIAGLEIAMI
jgi:hypothetical protein